MLFLASLENRRSSCPGLPFFMVVGRGSQAEVGFYEIISLMPQAPQPLSASSQTAKEP